MKHAKQPQRLSTSTALTFRPGTVADSYESITASSETVKILGELDEILLRHRRDVDHAWFLTDRQGYLYYRGDRAVGYGYLGTRNGPFALLDANDFPAVLTHAEREAATQGRREFGVEVPMVNQAAVDYLLARGFRMDSFIAILMNDGPFGKFENYILTSPPFIT